MNTPPKLNSRPSSARLFGGLLLWLAAIWLFNSAARSFGASAISALTIGNFAQIIMCPAIWFLCARRKISFRRFFALRLPKKKYLFEIGVAFIALVFALEIINYYFDFSSALENRRLKIFTDFAPAGDFFSIALLFANVIALAPLTEEMLFRGYCFRFRLSPYLLIALSSAIWTLAHAQFAPFALIEIFTLGIFLGWARLRSRSLFLCVFLHSLNNALAMCGSA